MIVAILEFPDTNFVLPYVTLNPQDLQSGNFGTYFPKY